MRALAIDSYGIVDGFHDKAVPRPQTLIWGFEAELGVRKLPGTGVALVEMIEAVEAESTGTGGRTRGTRRTWGRND